MDSVSIVVPVTEEMAAKFREFSKEALSDRRLHHHSSRKQHGYTKEKAWLHNTPGGLVMVVYLEGKMPEANAAFMKSKEPHDVWMKEKILSTLKVDLTQGFPEVGELLFDFES